MADIRNFEAELTVLCGFAPTEANAKELLIRGCYDVINRFKIVNPSILPQFAVEKEITDGNGYDITSDNVYMVLSVARNDKLCYNIPAELSYNAKDTSSIFYAIANSPVYYILNKTYYVKPDPTAEQTAKFSVIKFGDTVTSYDSASSSIPGFPVTYNYFIVLYAAIGLTIEELISLSVPSLDISATAPTAPTLSTDASGGISDVDLVFSSDTPTYTKPPSSFDTVQFENFLETNEDAELASIQLGRLQTELGTYQSDIQNELNEFNKELAIYNAAMTRAMETFRANLSIALKEGELADVKIIQDNMALIGKYQIEVASYQAEVNAEVSEFSADVKNIETQYSFYLKNLEALSNKYESLFVPYRSK
jgi:hypothetical protein